MSGRKSWGSVDVNAGIGASPPVRSGAPEEQRSLASDDSLGPVSNMLLIPRMPHAQCEVSSSLGYTSTRGESSIALFWACSSVVGNHTARLFVLVLFRCDEVCFIFLVVLLVRAVREDVGLSAGFKCPGQVHSGKC